MANSHPSVTLIEWMVVITRKEFHMLGTIVLVLLILMLVGAIPAWPHSKNWGYAPSGGLGLVVLILLILILTGRI
jgi:hypothetical protein